MLATENAAVDWSRPIEAVQDGVVFPATLDSGPDADGDYTVSWDDKIGFYVCATGEVRGLSWRIRNVQPTTPERDPMRERLEAFVRKVGDHSQQVFIYSGDATWLNDWIKEARAIAADLPKLVDPLIEEARRIKDAAYAADKGGMEHDWVTVAVMNGLRRGRELSRQGDAA